MRSASSGINAICAPRLQSSVFFAPYLFQDHFHRFVQLRVRPVLKEGIRIQLDLYVRLDPLEMDVIAASGVVVGNR